MELTEMKQRVYDTNIELVKRGLVIYTWGNVSMIDREKGIVVIKPRGVEYDDLGPENMSVTDLEGNQLEGDLLPSVDLDIHLAIYKQFKEVGGIAHTHSTYATSWAQARCDLPVYGTTHGDHFFGNIPCTRQLNEEETASGYEKHTGDVIVETFHERGIDPMQMGAVLVAGHGPFTWGKTPEEAVEHSVILEELSHMALLTREINMEAPQLEKHILEKHYLRKYGKDAYFYQEKK
ncbi:MAG: L-ribulose-5-phosphate 4-epimerase AraD [Solobacterium sp.]|nr:L-ribulose-5-phosphate 4-epimerase AraD [Solobacterium sp.]